MKEKETNETTDLLKLISKDFDRPGIEAVITIRDLSSLSELKQYLTEKLAYLLEFKFDRLINTLYLIDIDENKLSKLFAAENRDHIPSRLADLIIERQIQKLQIRQKYKRKKD